MIVSILLHMLVSAFAGYVIADWLGMGFLYGWFAAVNLVELLAFGKDKLASKLDLSRTPEMTFLTMGVLGAFPAILLGRKLFHHKTSKLAFVVPMWLLFIAQLAFAAWWLGDLAGLGAPPPDVATEEPAEKSSKAGG